MGIVTHEVVAQNTGTDAVECNGSIQSKMVAYDIQNDLGNGTVISLQHAPLDGDAWTTVKTFANGATDLVGNATIASGWKARLWCETGNFGTGDTPLLKIG